MVIFIIILVVLSINLLLTITLGKPTVINIILHLLLIALTILIYTYF